MSKEITITLAEDKAKTLYDGLMRVRDGFEDKMKELEAQKMVLPIMKMMNPEAYENAIRLAAEECGLPSEDPMDTIERIKSDTISSKNVVEEVLAKIELEIMI